MPGEGTQIGAGRARAGFRRIPRERPRRFGGRSDLTRSPSRGLQRTVHAHRRPAHEPTYHPRSTCIRGQDCALRPARCWSASAPAWCERCHGAIAGRSRPTSARTGLGRFAPARRSRPGRRRRSRPRTAGPVVGAGPGVLGDRRPVALAQVEAEAVVHHGLGRIVRVHVEHRTEYRAAGELQRPQHGAGAREHLVLHDDLLLAVEVEVGGDRRVPAAPRHLGDQRPGRPVEDREFGEDLDVAVEVGDGDLPMVMATISGSPALSTSASAGPLPRIPGTSNTVEPSTPRITRTPPLMRLGSISSTATQRSAIASSRGSTRRATIPASSPGCRT